MPHAPSVGDSQLSSSNRMSCCRGLMPHGLETLEIELLHFVGRRLEDHLELVVLEQPVRVLAEAAVGRPARRLDVRDVPVRRAEHAQKRLGMHRAGADLDVERLLQRAPARRPEFRQLENEILKGHRHVIAASLATRAPTSGPSPDASRSARDARASSSRSARRDTATSPSANGLDVRAASRNARASPDMPRARPRRRPAAAAASTRNTAPAARSATPAAIASTTDAPSRNSVSFGSSSCAHSSISSAKYPT